jgi:hypothetical protein
MRTFWVAVSLMKGGSGGRLFSCADMKTSCACTSGSARPANGSRRAVHYSSEESVFTAWAVLQTSLAIKRKFTKAAS